MKQKFERLPHPAVDWNTVYRAENGRLLVQTTCPYCHKKQFDDAGQVAYRIRKGTYTGYCYKDRLLNKVRVDRLERPAHPQVDWDDTEIVLVKGQRLTHVRITCPDCGQKRLKSPGPIAAKIRQGKFTGRCIPCSGFEKKHDWVNLGQGKKIEPVKGYIRLGRAAIAQEDLWLYEAMKDKRTYLLEHRLVMARQLQRPLQSNELVDHMDGIKTNNDPTNLRLYIRGKNQPGETSGYGTYYHEWQLALTRIHELEQEIERLKS